MMGNLTIFMRQFKMKRVLAPFSKAKGGKTDDVCRGSLITKQALACSLPPLILSSWIINFYLEIFTFFSFDLRTFSGESEREQTYTSSHSMPVLSCHQQTRCKLLPCVVNRDPPTHERRICFMLN